MTRRAWCIALLLVAGRPAAAQSHGAVEEILSARETVVGEPLRYPEGDAPAVHAVVITLQPGETTVRHRHGVPLFAYILEGELTVDYVGHEKRVFRTGDGLLEAMSVLHVGQNTGATPLRILAVYLGAAGRRETVTEAAAPR